MSFEHKVWNYLFKLDRVAGAGMSGGRAAAGFPQRSPLTRGPRFALTLSCSPSILGQKQRVHLLPPAEPSVPALIDLHTSPGKSEDGIQRCTPS
ncbi:hypothetical protein VP01_1271g9 [Puccinia sorghi]|uniref:Uncharacterized protein n=1 Tax=Puccinia sorghi TaxID=27349 RepID=A0A0L6VP92_9BASI|nr:hypothetical protein VP01_1271g9 [Puccinia sorghi]